MSRSLNSTQRNGRNRHRPTQHPTQQTPPDSTPRNERHIHNATRHLNAGFARPGLNAAGSDFGRRCGLLEKRQIQLNAILCTRGVQRGIEATGLGTHEFSLFHPFLRHRPQNTVGQISELFPIRWVLVLHLTLHYLLTLLRGFLPSYDSCLSDSQRFVMKSQQSSCRFCTPVDCSVPDVKKTQSICKPRSTSLSCSCAMSRSMAGTTFSRTSWVSFDQEFAASMAVPCPTASALV